MGAFPWRRSHLVSWRARRSCDRGFSRCGWWEIKGVPHKRCITTRIRWIKPLLEVGHPFDMCTYDIPYTNIQEDGWKANCQFVIPIVLFRLQTRTITATLHVVLVGGGEGTWCRGVSRRILCSCHELSRGDKLSE